ncbi:peptide methionine sulfoxide reductase [Vagococcus lutrae]|uniref:peptide methionine sulfoxide reductase n=1 Tax=Vagococcus lutrae TaxID=81947 RepID=UPI00200E34AA|nr:peptide methionine sulfoxide reductase [Vagococcus lutrae]UQF24209.1 peptide methionine sulfoxide reductase [Vagococcus lutrae]
MDQEREELLWEMWVHTSMEKPFKDFKKEQKAKSFRQKQKAKPVTEETEKKLFDFASQFVKIKPPQS